MLFQGINNARRCNNQKLMTVITCFVLPVIFLQTNFNFVHSLLSLKFGAYAYYVRSYTNIYKLMLRNNKAIYKVVYRSTRQYIM